MERDTGRGPGAERGAPVPRGDRPQGFPGRLLRNDAQASRRPLDVCQPAHDRVSPIIVEFATKNRLPTMFSVREDIVAGGLMSYAANVPHIFRRAAGYVGKILKGSKPGDLPIEQPTEFELVINLKTAKPLGLTI